MALLAAGALLVLPGAAFGQQLPYYYSNPPEHAGKPERSAAPLPLPTITPPPPPFEKLPVVTLAQCVKAAQTSAPNILIAKATVDTAQAQFAQVRATNSPKLSGSASYAHADNLPIGNQTTTSSAIAAQTAAQTVESGGSGQGDNFAGGVALSGPATSVSANVHHLSEAGAATDQMNVIQGSASQTLFDGYFPGRASATVTEADYTFRQAQVNYQATLLTVLYQVKQSYYTLLGDQNTVRADLATVAEYEQNLKFVQAELAAQLATQLDVLQAQVTLRQAQLALATAENTVNTDRKNLSLAIGWPLDRQYQVAEAEAPSVPTSNEAQALETAYKNRPELKTFAFEIASARTNLALQRALYFPVVAANGSVSYFSDSTANTSSGTYTVGASLSVPIYQGGLLAAQVQAARAQLSSLEIQQAQEHQTITIAVQSGLFNVETAKQGLEVATQNVQAAEGQYERERSLLAVGLATNLDVLTALSSLTTAQVSLQQAKTTYALDVLALINAMGL